MLACIDIITSARLIFLYRCGVKQYRFTKSGCPVKSQRLTGHEHAEIALTFFSLLLEDGAWSFICGEGPEMNAHVTRSALWHV